MEDDDGIPEMPRLQAQMFSSAGPHRLLMRVKRYDAATKKYGPWKCFTDADCSIEHYHDSQTQLLNIQSCLDFPLKRGGNLRIFPKLLSDEPLERLVAEIDNDPLFRQYTIQNHNEPRLHYLLSSSDEEENTSRQEQAMIPRTPVGKGHAEGIGMMTSPTAFWGNQQTQAADFCSPQASEKCSSRAKLITPDPSQTSSSSSSQSSSSQSPKICGYNYHGVHMEPVAPMPRFPSILNVSKTLGSLARIPHFSIGGNIVLYRNGADCIGWHADDTHEEEKISCLVAVCPDVTTTGARICVHSHNESDTPKFYTQCARPLKIRTKSATGAGAKLEDGDEFIELYMFSGDAYEMDSKLITEDE